MRTIIIALLITFACSTKLNTVEEDQQLMWNPQGLVQCLKEAAPFSKDVIEILHLLTAKDYEAALATAIELINAGSQLVKKCIEYIISSSVSLSVNWIELGKCIMSVAELFGYGQMLVAALIDNNKTVIMSIVSTLSDKIPAKCKRFW